MAFAVLGDAELVVPLHVSDSGLGRPYDVGAVDRLETRDQVCLLLECGVEGYTKRVERYGFRFAAVPKNAWEASDPSRPARTRRHLLASSWRGVVVAKGLTTFCGRHRDDQSSVS